VEVLRRFAMRPLDGVRITLVSEASSAAYSGMLPGHVAGHYTDEEIRIDLRRLCRAAGARFVAARACGLDPVAGVVELEGRPGFSFDLVSLNTGSTPDLARVPGAAEHAIPVKPVDRFLDRLEAVTAGQGVRSIAMVGGGATGVEMILALRHRLGMDAGHRFTLFEAGPHILPTLNPRAGGLVLRAMTDLDVEVVSGVTVSRVEDGRLCLSDGRRVSAEVIAWATGARAPDWFRDTMLGVDDRGFVRVDDTLRSVSHPSVFAAGDVASLDSASLAKAGVFAVREGPVLADNLRAALMDRPLRPYRPQRRFLNLLATGPKHAVASRGSFAAAGDWAWRWKDKIDRRFMARYADMAVTMGRDKPADRLPTSGATSEPEEMRCKGCGAKLGPDILSRALHRLCETSSAVDLSALDDAAVMTPPAGKTLLQSVDFFPAIIDDPYLFGRIAAVHCLGDLHAMGAEPWTALATAQVPPASDAMMEDDLHLMLAGAASVFEAEGARIVGGHSGESDELALGFTVNGLADPDTVRRKGGLKPGDVLVLTKPLGTGVLFAGDMRGLVKPGWIDTALASMTASSGAAGRILMAHGATAMTDVTGFGLAGHLGEMLVASGVDAELDLAALPALDGADEMIRARIESSLAPANRVRVMALLEDTVAWTEAELTLLADPQTAGGLLAGVPADHVNTCLTALRAGGVKAVAVGRISARRGNVPIISRG